MATQFIFGTFIFANIVFEANYRYAGPLYNQGGYEKCLAISQGVGYNGYSIYGHSYFGDDKFGVKTAEIYPDKVILNLTYPLRSRCDYLEVAQVITLRRTT